MAQHLDALALANEIRFGRAAIKRDLKDGIIDIRDMIVDPPLALHSMTVYDLLTSMHRWGRGRTLRLLVVVGFSEFLTVGGMTERQRELLVRTLNNRKR